MALKTIDIFITLVVNLAQCVYTEDFLPCNVTSIRPCPGSNWICVQESGQCKCEEGFYRSGNECETYDVYSSNVSTTATVVTTFTLALVICGLILVVRKYNLLEYMRQKISRRNIGVEYEDVMIGQDDPPLSL